MVPLRCFEFDCCDVRRRRLLDTPKAEPVTPTRVKEALAELDSGGIRDAIIDTPASTRAANLEMLRCCDLSWSLSIRLFRNFARSVKRCPRFSAYPDQLLSFGAAPAKYFALSMLLASLNSPVLGRSSTPTCGSARFMLNHLFTATPRSKISGTETQRPRMFLLSGPKCANSLAPDAL